MMRRKFFAALLAAILPAVPGVYGGRPLAVDDADPVDYRHFELEAGGGYMRDSDCKHWHYPFGLTYGLVSGVEAGVGFGGQFEERTELVEEGGKDACVREHGMGDLVLGAKWRFANEAGWRPRQALAPSVKFPTAEDDKGLGSGETDYDLTWIASKSFGEDMGVHVNGGYSWIGEPDGEDVGDIVHYGAALDYCLGPSLQWVGEVFAEKELRDGAKTIVQYVTGFRWNPVDGVTLDMAGGSKLSGDAPDYRAMAGLTWGFGPGSDDGKGAN